MKQIVTKNSKKVNENKIIGTADIGLTKNMGYCRSTAGNEMKPFEFSNNDEGFRKFWDTIVQFKEQEQIETIMIGIESTGVYGAPFLNFMKDKPVELVQVNPKHTKRIKEIVDNSPLKSDKKDPKVIADIIELGRYLSVVVPEGAAAELRILTHARERVLRRINILNNQLHALVFTIFPEFIHTMKDLKTKSAQYILEHMPTPEDIIQYGKERLTDKLREVSRGMLSEERAGVLYESAQRTVGIQEGRISIVKEIRMIVNEMRQSAHYMEEIERDMTMLLKQISYARNILSVKGIGPVITAGLIGEFADLRKFRNSQQVLKYAGLNLFEISSGNRRGQRRISKIGRSLIRKLLFFAVINMIRNGGIMHERYLSYCKRGMMKIKAIIAIMRKVLSLIFALVRHNTEYQNDYLVFGVQQIKQAA